MTLYKMEVIQAEEINNYEYSVELLEVEKLLIIVFNTITGIKYQTYIQTKTKIWDDIKINFQNKFTLLHKLLEKALLKPDDTTSFKITHHIDKVDLEINYNNDFLGFSVLFTIEQHNKDNAQEKINILTHRLNNLQTENEGLHNDISILRNEMKDIKDAVNILGDSMSAENIVFSGTNGQEIHNQKRTKNGIILYKRDGDPNKCHHTDLNKFINRSHKSINDQGRSLNNNKKSVHIPKGHHDNFNHVTNQDKIDHPFLNKDIFNKINKLAFEDMIKEHNIEYNIEVDGYDWSILGSMLENKGKSYNINDALYEYINHNYNISWNAFKNLMDIKI
jgi:hypothetical protein